MIKEIQEESLQEKALNKDMSKNDELSKNDSNIEIKTIQNTSDINISTLNSEVSKSPKIKNILTNNNKEGNKLNGKNEFNLKSEHPNEKPYSSLSSLISNELKCNTNNNQYKTPLRKGSSPLNYKQKPKYNYQEKLNMEKETGTKFKNHRNSISIRSPIYSYFDESQKFLNEHYSEENIFNLPGNNKNKTSSNKEIKKKIHKFPNSETKNVIQLELKNSDPTINKDPKEENEIETPNYNDYNFFTDSNMSPDYYNNISQISNGINNLYGNKFSRKLSQATGSYKEGNSIIKHGNFRTRRRVVLL